MNILTKRMVTYLTEACEYKLDRCLICIVILFMMFNLLEAEIEKMIYGDRFFHYLDFLFIGYIFYFTFLTIKECNKKHGN